MLRVMSTFSGISAASIAWKPLGFEFVAYAEIEPFACHVLSARLGVSGPKYLPSMSKRKLKAYEGLPILGIPNLGDISQITDDDLKALGRVDVLEGGSPCQAFSIAGLRGGLGDERGNLMLEFCRLADRMKEINGLRYVVWENVKGVLSIGEGKAFGCLLGALAGEMGGFLPPRTGWKNAGFAFQPEGVGSVGWRVFDAQFFGVPQRRERIFVVADFADKSGASGTILFESKSEDRFATSCSEAEEGDDIRVGECLGQLTASNDNRLIHPRVFGTLMASGAGMSRPAGVGSELDFVIVQEIDGEVIVRRPHPIECERLQGFPDDWTNVEFKGKPPLDQDRYRTLGNTMATPCMKFLGLGLMEYHQEQLDLAA
ncbi:DNA cytosine methyltransferase [Brucella ciceri]|uniref:DNA cytosine methyltransferase n=1 Tax=Brucella ciceri TaxID=391287 RepID=UPI0013AFFEC3|nr:MULTISPECIES: DNA cytosine methyltransferase [Brucella]MCH6206652.1 DNA cytosine methyltransferase [Brucella ciceri]